jgi:hypothetical protein
MRSLHVTPGPSAGGSLRQALRSASLDDDVWPCWDDLSCGPIGSDVGSGRLAWWAQLIEEPEVMDAQIRAFWDRVATTDDRLVVWFGRHSALELAFFLAWAEKLGDRSYKIVDVTGWSDGTSLPPASAVSLIPPMGLKSLLGTERQVGALERDLASQQWRRLKTENAPFRVVSEVGLVSAPIDYFDPLLMEWVTPEWRKVARVIGDTLGRNLEPYYQVGDLVLRWRVAVLIENGKLLADGDPRDVQSCLVRLPG